MSGRITVKWIMNVKYIITFTHAPVVRAQIQGREKERRYSVISSLLKITDAVDY